MSSDEASYPEPNSVSYSERYPASSQLYSDTLVTQYHITISYLNDDVQSNDTYSRASTNLASQHGHPSYYENLPLTRQALAQHDGIQDSAAADKCTDYLPIPSHGPRVVRPYLVGEKAYTQNKHRAFHGVNKSSRIPGENIINIPYPISISEVDINDQETQVDFSDEERVAVKDVQAGDCPSTNGSLYGAGAQFDSSSLSRL